MQPQGTQPDQPTGLRSQSQMMGADGMFNPAPDLVGLCLVNPETSAPRTTRKRTNAQVLQLLLTGLQPSNFPQQKQQVLRILKSNPHLMAAFIKHRLRQPQQQQQQLPTEIAASLTPSEVMGTEESQTMGANDMLNPTGPATGGVGFPLVMADRGTSASETPSPQRSDAQVLQLLLTFLRSSSFPQQKQQVLDVLKPNPQLMAPFIKQRSSQPQQQQQILASLHKGEVGLAPKTAASDERIGDDYSAPPPYPPAPLAPELAGSLLAAVTAVDDTMPVPHQPMYTQRQCSRVTGSSTEADLTPADATPSLITAQSTRDPVLSTPPTHSPSP